MFNLNKGSIPVRLGMDLDKFDQCAKDSAAEFSASAKSGTLVPSWAHEMAMPPANKGAMFDVVTAFMNTPGMTPKQAAERMAVAGKSAARASSRGRDANARPRAFPTAAPHDGRRVNGASSAQTTRVRTTRQNASATTSRRHCPSSCWARR